jgi:hypothetical protein
MMIVMTIFERVFMKAKLTLKVSSVLNTVTNFLFQ